MFIIKEGVTGDQIGQNTEDSTKQSIINWLGQNGYTVRTGDEDKSFVNSKVQTEVNNMYAKSRVELEERVKQLTGIDRTGDGEKASDYMERAFKEKLAGIEELNKQIETLKSQGVNGNEQAQEYKKQLEELQANYQKLSSEKDEQIEGLHKQIFDSQVKSIIDTELSSILPTLNADIDPTLMRDIVDTRLRKFNAENKAAKFEDSIIFKDANGTTITSKQDGKPMNAAELLKPYFEDLVDKKRRQNGAGSGSGFTIDPEGKKIEVNKPDNVKTKVQLTEFLTRTEGGPKLDVNTKEFAQAFNELGKELPLK